MESNMDYLIIGNGIAGTTAAENLRKADDNAAITIITNEDTPFYSRLRLNEYVAGKLQKDALIVRKPEWYLEKNITLQTQTEIKKIDTENKKAVSADGKEYSYGKLLYAAGSYPFIPPINGVEKEGVFALRSFEDADRIIAYSGDKESKSKKRVVLLGGGLLGLELGHALIEKGMEVTVVEQFPRLLPRQLDCDGADCLQQMMEKTGLKFVLGAKTETITGESCVEGVALDNGISIEADMVIVSAGVRPNSKLIADAGVKVNMGVIIDDKMQTSVQDIYAAGDLIEHNGRLYGNWMIAMEQGKLAAQSMSGAEVSYSGSIMSMILKVIGIDLGSVGEIDAESEFECRVKNAENFYQKIVCNNDGKVIGGIMVGSKKGFPQIVKAVNNRDSLDVLAELCDN
ncbi:MAG: NAD(P)/FAD-dependent oxidoreductase [Gammaproteobacteria bacterium]|nr:MAG: NAD(P)/FAD-dependent oxidoreductase [Gammaproteobacteria bacterium]